MKRTDLFFFFAIFLFLIAILRWFIEEDPFFAAAASVEYHDTHSALGYHCIEMVKRFDAAPCGDDGPATVVFTMFRLQINSELQY